MADRPDFSGEDENAGFASPVQDLIASAVLILLSVIVIVESVRLGSPGNSVATAPGLLPFVVAGSLCAMAVGLGLMSAKRYREVTAAVPDNEMPEHLRVFGLAVLIEVYLAGLQLMQFEYRFMVGDVQVGYGAFEILTIIALTVILAVFWNRPLLSCMTVSIVWTTLLAGVFRYVFIVPLPGSV